MPPCTSPQQTGCTNPDTGLVQIGSVTARTSNYSWQTSWDPEGIGGSGMYYDGYTRQFTQNLAQCTYDQGAEIASAAFGLAVYLRDHGNELQSATADIITYARVYLAGGATAAEFFLAAGAVLGVADWAIALGAIGIGLYEAGKLIRCAALGAGST
jgi:hypothetical protein